MILQTNLKHVVTDTEFKEVIQNNENVMICCGRMGPMCIPVYQTMKRIEGEYSHVEFYDMLFDNPYAHVIRNLPECRGFMGLPFTVYYKNGKLVKATGSIQSEPQIRQVLDAHF
jgi:thioredoxin 1